MYIAFVMSDQNFQRAACVGGRRTVLALAARVSSVGTATCRRFARLSLPCKLMHMLHHDFALGAIKRSLWASAMKRMGVL